MMFSHCLKDLAEAVMDDVPDIIRDWNNHFTAESVISRRYIYTYYVNLILLSNYHCICNWMKNI